MKISPIIEAKALSEILEDANVMIFDVSNGKNALTNYKAQHITGAIFIDLNSRLAQIKEDFSNGGRHPLPTVESFAETLTALGISKGTHVVIYDDKNGSNAAARFWWMLRSAGHENVQVLNGGLDEAKKQNISLSSAATTPQRAKETYVLEQWLLPIALISEVEDALHNPNYLIVDVRDKERFDGLTEPIDLIAGHIPGAKNIPFTENLDENGLFLKPQQLKSKYEQAFGKMRTDQIIVHCGSGVTACHTLLALDYAGIAIPNLYVGSWSEWSRNDKKIETAAG